MTPTNRLRWRITAVYAPPVLQQWWAEYLTDTETMQPVEVKGEWRDVPFEGQA